MNCYDCPNLRIMYLNTLKENAVCTKFKKIIPVGLMADCFWCTEIKHEPKGDSTSSDGTS